MGLGVIAYYENRRLIIKLLPIYAGKCVKITRHPSQWLLAIALFDAQVKL